MARHCEGWVVRGLLSVAVVCAADVACAQLAPQDPSVPSLFEPQFDAGTVRPQQFRKPGLPATPATPGLSRPATGSTGFDATNANARRKARDAAKKRAAAEAENLPPIVSSGPDRTVATVFQRQESGAALRRRATNTAAAPLDAAGAIAPRPIRKRIVEEDPFGPLGTYYGAFLFKPAVDISGGYNSNPNQRQNGKGSTFEQVAPELSIRSNWSRHEWNTDLRGSYIWYNDNDLQRLSKPDFNVRSTGRIDITKDTKANLEGYFAVAADNPGDPNLPTDVASPPLFVSTGGVAGLTQTFNRLELSAKSSLDRTAYGDAELNDGSLLDLRDRNYNQYGLKLRASYETLPDIKPFVELGGDQRRHDRTLDATGLNRDSDGRSIKVGTTFKMTGYLVGEASVGLFERDYANPGFQKLHGTLLDASLTYFATPLTTLKLDVKTTVDESVLGGVSGTLQRDFGLQIDHAFRRWLIGTLKLGYGTDNYEGSARDDERYTVSAGIIYKMTRDVHLRGEYRREWLRSTFVGQDYTSNIFTVGLRLQR